MNKRKVHTSIRVLSTFFRTSAKTCGKLRRTYQSPVLLRTLHRPLSISPAIHAVLPFSMCTFPKTYQLWKFSGRFTFMFLPSEVFYPRFGIREKCNAAIRG